MQVALAGFGGAPPQRPGDVVVVELAAEGQQEPVAAAAEEERIDVEMLLVPRDGPEHAFALVRIAQRQQGPAVGIFPPDREQAGFAAVVPPDGAEGGGAEQTPGDGRQEPAVVPAPEQRRGVEIVLAPPDGADALVAVEVPGQRRHEPVVAPAPVHGREVQVVVAPEKRPDATGVVRAPGVGADEAEKGLEVVGILGRALVDEGEELEGTVGLPLDGGGGLQEQAGQGRGQESALREIRHEGLAACMGCLDSDQASTAENGRKGLKWPALGAAGNGGLTFGRVPGKVREFLNGSAPVAEPVGSLSRPGAAPRAPPRGRGMPSNALPDGVMAAHGPLEARV